ncbi:hypothetical protein AB1K62_05865 [Parasphingorhabdus sp. JC815]|uniref:hypothetical protein n=1 Tax=Parasphingorhabdus sp. JC815 TaxID=3232140 RepID=UPI003457A33A
MSGPSQLDDPLYAGVAWSRYWRLMRWMCALTILCVAIALGLLYFLHGMVSIHMYIATAAGVGFALLLTSALMGLVFMSSTSGHDDSVENHLDEDLPPDE